MAMEITNSFGNSFNGTYERIYAEPKETAVIWKNNDAAPGNSDYLHELSKLAPSVKIRVGITHASAKSGKTLTINPKLIEKMQNDPEFEKEMKELIKGVELMTKFSESLNKATGRTTVFRHGYIDENGKYSHSALVRNDAGYKMSAKLREERWKASANLAKRIKEKTAKRRKGLKKIDIRI